MREKYKEMFNEHSEKKFLDFSPTTMLAPIPAVMVTVGDLDTANIITIGWTGVINSKPPMTYVSIRKSRYSYNLIKECGEFAINLVGENMARACDFCGVKSGKDIDKWKELQLEKEMGIKISTPSIKGSPGVLECKVTKTMDLGSHTMFFGEIINTRVREDLVEAGGRIELEKARLVAYVHGHYYPVLAKPLGKFGYSVMKPKTKRKIAKKRRSQGNN